MALGKHVDGFDTRRSRLPKDLASTLWSPSLSDSRPQLKALDDEVDDFILVRLLVIVVLDDDERVHHDGKEHVDEHKRHHEHKTEEKKRTEDAIGVIV